MAFSGSGVVVKKGTFVVEQRLVPKFRHYRSNVKISTTGDWIANVLRSNINYMSAESEILAEVDALKAKFADTRALYREVCVLLFFRHGITPTANKLYQYVRRGSMNVPTEEVAKFWDDLRHKARVDIEHPDLPDGVKATAAEAIAALWRQATDVARAELAGARLELQAEAEGARGAQAAAEVAARAVREELEQQRAALVQRDDTVRAIQSELDAERRAHAGAQGRVQELQSQLEQSHGQQQRQQEAFSADLAKARGDIETAQERAAAAERRALMEIEQERQARSRAEKTVENVRDKLSESQNRERRLALEHAESATRSQMELNVKGAALQRAQEAQEAAEEEAAACRQQLAEARQAAASSAAEAQTLRALVERLTPSAPMSEASGRRSRRKAAPVSSG